MIKFKAAKGKRHVIYKGTKTRTTVDILSDTMQAKDSETAYLKYWRWKKSKNLEFSSQKWEQNE